MKKFILLSFSAIIVILLGFSFLFKYQAKHSKKNYEFNKQKLLSNNKKEFTFAVVGDLGGAFPVLIDQIRKDKPDAIFIAGDLAYKYIEKYFMIKNVIDNTSIPTFAVMGNHDQRISGDYLFKKFFGPKYFQFVLGDSLFLGLNNSTGTFTMDDMSKLKTTLSSSQNKSKFIIMHYPPKDPRNNKETAQILDNTARKLFIKFCSDYNVTAVFCGHIHSYYEYTIGKSNTKVYISGGGGQELETKDDINHYLLVKVNPDSSITVKKHNIDWNLKRFFLWIWFEIMTFCNVNFNFLLIVAILLWINGIWNFKWTKRKSVNAG